VFGVHTVAYAAYGFWDEETVRDTDNNVTTDHDPLDDAGSGDLGGKH